jgi:hypothetical protein
MHVENEVSVVGDVWNPVTGERHPLPRACYSGWAAAGRTIVALPCPGDGYITTVDAVSGIVHHLPLPRRYAGTAFESFAPLAPSGHELAVIVGQGVPRPGLLDLRTSRFRPVPVGVTLAPAGWSSDGQWVLLADAGGFGNGRRPRLALWRPRDGRLTSVRLSPGTSLIASVQLLTPDG